MDNKTVESRSRLLSSELERFIDIVAKEMNPEQVLLFGSVAQDRITEWTDLDLVVIADTDLAFFERSRLVIDKVAPGVGMDVLVYTPEEWKDMKRDRAFITNEVIDKGRTVYERSRQEVG